MPTYTPEMTTDPATDIGPFEFTANGSYALNKKATSMTRRGFCYIQGSEGEPTTSDNVVFEDGSWAPDTSGSYSLVISGLSHNTSYRVRAYGINDEGIGYGATITVTTLVKDPEPISATYDGQGGVSEDFSTVFDSRSGIKEPIATATYDALSEIVQKQPWQTIDVGDVSEYTIEQLSAGNEYEIQVRAYDSQRFSLWSDSVVGSTQGGITLDFSWAICEDEVRDTSFEIRGTDFHDISWGIEKHHSAKTAWKIEEDIGEGTPFSTVYDARGAVFTPLLTKKYDAVGIHHTDLKRKIDAYVRTAFTVDHTYDSMCEIGELPSGVDIAYDIEWGKADDSFLFRESSLVDENFEIVGLEPNTTYRWRVRVLTSQGIHEWSYWKTFTTSNGLIANVAWHIGHLCVTAWQIRDDIKMPFSYKIFSRHSQGLSWKIMQKNMPEVAWQIEEIIPPPINRKAIEITYTSAKLTWEAR